MKIIVECYGDNLLVKQLKYEALAVHSGIGQVANLMIKYYKGKIAIGIIDNDKSSIPRYFQEFEIIRRKGSFIFLKHPKCNHFLVKVVPAFEGFILKAADDCDIKRETYRLPTDDKAFREITKDESLHKNQRFVNFLNAIVTQNPNPIKELRKCIDDAVKAK